MGLLLALAVPLGLALVSGAVAFGGKASRPLAVGAFVLAVLAVCMVLLNAS
jgi:hypothetical protein